MLIQEERQLPDTVAWHKVLSGKGYSFFAVHFEGFIENYPFLFEGLQNILKGKWRAGPQNKGNSPSNLLPAPRLLCLQMKTWLSRELGKMEKGSMHAYHLSNIKSS